MLTMIDPPPTRIRKAKAGDRQALDSLLEDLQGRLRTVVERHLGTELRARLRASDVLQSTYLDVVRSIRDFQGDDEEAFVAWVAAIVQNNVYDKGKYFNAGKRRSRDGADQALDDRLAIPDPTPTPSMRAVRIENLLLVSKALENLSELHRQVLFLKLVEDRSHKEIADTIDRTEPATRMLLSRARAALALEMDRLSPGQ